MHCLRLLALSSLLVSISSLPHESRRSESAYVALPFGTRQKAHGSGLRGRAFVSPLVPSEGEYYIEVDIGTPPQTVDLVLDTGSSEIWAYAPQACSDCTTQYCEIAAQSTRTWLTHDRRPDRLLNGR